jgi:hypothetical protein
MSIPDYLFYVKWSDALYTNGLRGDRHPVSLIEPAKSQGDPIHHWGQGEAVKPSFYRGFSDNCCSEKNTPTTHLRVILGVFCSYFGAFFVLDLLSVLSVLSVWCPCGHYA